MEGWHAIIFGQQVDDCIVSARRNTIRSLAPPPTVPMMQMAAQTQGHLSPALGNTPVVTCRPWEHPCPPW
ncbi:unnamed protein product [Cyprideis torosa]|uniref:Uncharacterized protein n=1 Tax=Cyprideis torosa TaxID=163714 RepID=A0A7R8WUV2_9CRUS|nr:unnamed protein product [Cyprideis torosa]CAG0909335.1 unnamed protein product [Cyprideis torosa]